MRSRRTLKWALFLTVFLVLASSVLFFNDVPPTQGQTTASAETCLMTPETLGGQGFSVGGLGFSVGGLGFSVGGLGFSVGGLGFSVGGLGIDPAQVAQEIRDNSISNQWLLDLQADIGAGPEFNTTPTAILILDDFSSPDAHGYQVLAVFNHLADAIDMSNITLVQVDISDGNMGYRTDNLKWVVQDTIEGPGGLIEQGYKHFVLNMSFGVIPCEDSGMMLDGTPMPEFNFDEAMSWIDAWGPVTDQAVEPVLTCVKKKPDNSYIASFGYKNHNTINVPIPVGTNNRFNPTPQNRNQPFIFEPGEWGHVFQVGFANNASLTWTLRGPDGVARNVTANKYSPLCALPAAPTDMIKPILECVSDSGGGVFTARFGYENFNLSTVTILVGNNNYFTPNPKDRGQTITFLPGLHEDVFRVNFNGNLLKWTLKSPDGNYYTVEATKYSPPCIDQLGVGLIDYWRYKGVPEDKIEHYAYKLVESVDDEAALLSFRGLLKEYLERSATSNGEFSVIPVASSGNYRPWLGSWPLAPARWPEVIATGASVGNNGPMWQFSHDGNVIAPGAGFPYGNNGSIAGTSFAAPFVSMVGAQWLTYPNACFFDGLYPPLTEIALGKDLLAVFTSGTTEPYNCSPFYEPEPDPDYEKKGEWKLIESDDPIVEQHGTWSSVSTPQASGGSYLYSSGSTNDILSFGFEGESLEVVYLAYPSLGIFTIMVDDIAVRTVITQAAGTEYGKVTVIDYLSPGPHEVKIVPIQGVIAIDAFYATVE